MYDDSVADSGSRRSLRGVHRSLLLLTVRAQALSPSQRGLRTRLDRRAVSSRCRTSPAHLTPRALGWLDHELRGVRKKFLPTREAPPTREAASHARRVLAR